MQQAAQVETTPASSSPPVPAARQREAVRQGASLTMVALLIVLILGAFALVVLARYRRTLLDGGRRAARKHTARSDAWRESARRLHAPDDNGSDDDTVDIDPSDLSPDDVDDGPGRGGKGGRR